MSEFVSGQALAELVLGYEHTAFRLEQRDDRYREPEEGEPFRRFLDGEPVTVTGWNDDCDFWLVDSLLEAVLRVARQLLDESATSVLRDEIDRVLLLPDRPVVVA